jgi:hypothetical protein
MPSPSTLPLSLRLPLLLLALLVVGCPADTAPDDDPNNFPGNPELCDGADNDCSGAPDADVAGEVDGDSDGALSCVD